jgi:tRNA A37 methylthiotransferase MiaB
VREFSFLADDCGSYGDDCGTDLLQLLRAALAVDPAVTFKLLYLYPHFLQQRSAELLEIFRTGRISFVHIPLQSGSQRLLNLMNRSYDIAAVMASICQLRAISPATRLVTHLLLNFPTESAADFRASLAVAAHFDDAIFLHYSENQDTVAARLQPKVSREEARKRLDAASLFVNQRTGGSGCVIADFNCTTPYNLLPGEE